MDNRVQNEIDKTLACLDEGLDIVVDPGFAQGLTNKMAQRRITQVSAHRRHVSYPLVIIILLVLNLGVCILGMSWQQDASDTETTTDVSSVLASEYGLGNNVSF